jgi:hypothetical protein
VHYIFLEVMKERGKGRLAGVGHALWPRWKRDRIYDLLDFLKIILKMVHPLPDVFEGGGSMGTKRTLPCAL